VEVGTLVMVKAVVVKAVVVKAVVVKAVGVTMILAQSRISSRFSMFCIL
jgi:hypothetical protein